MFITLEGIDGCGKSTQARLICEALSARGAVVQTREPGGWEGGAELRSMVLGGWSPAAGRAALSCARWFSAAL